MEFDRPKTMRDLSLLPSIRADSSSSSGRVCAVVEPLTFGIIILRGEPVVRDADEGGHLIP